MKTFQVEKRLGTGVVYNTTEALKLENDKVFTFYTSQLEMVDIIDTPHCTPEYIEYIKSNPTHKVGILIDNGNFKISERILTELNNINNTNVNVVVATAEKQEKILVVDENKIYVTSENETTTYNRDIYDWHRAGDIVKISLRSGCLDKPIIIRGV